MARASRRSWNAELTARRGNSWIWCANATLASRERLREWSAVFAARHGDLSAMLEPLNDPSLPAAKQAAIGASVRRDVLDLPALAECRTLASEHPLRSAARCLVPGISSGNQRASRR